MNDKPSRDVLKRRGKVLRELREAAGLTQKDLAHKSGVSARTIGNAENGGMPTRNPTLRLLFLALGIEWAERPRPFRAL